MFLKIEHFLVAVIAIVGVVMFVLITDKIATDNRNEQRHRYDSQFAILERMLAEKKFDELLILADSILGVCGTGINEVRAKCLVGIVYVNKGELRKARDIIFYLEETYPLLGSSYYTSIDYTNADQQKYTFETILSMYIPVMLQPEKPLDAGEFLRTLRF